MVEWVASNIKVDPRVKGKIRYLHCKIGESPYREVLLYSHRPWSVVPP